MSRSLLSESLESRKVSADRSKSSLFHGIVGTPHSQVARALSEYRDYPNLKQRKRPLEDFQDEYGKMPVMQAVRDAERRVEDNHKNDQFFPNNELHKFTRTMTKLVLGAYDECPSTLHVGSVPTGLGIYGLVLAGRLLTQRGPPVIYLSKPTCWYHQGALTQGGFTEFREYRYVNYETKCLDLEGMLTDLKAVPPRSVVMLQPCGHNPTGIDPTLEEWMKILEIVKTNQLLPLWESGLHGLASGDFDTDAWAVRHCFSLGIEFLCTQTTAKCFRLDYDNGNLIIATNSGEQLAAVKSYAIKIAYSTNAGSSVDSAATVGEILSNSELEKKWKVEVKEMVERMKAMRTLLRKKLEELKTPGTWSHITDQVGLFAFLGLDARQCKYLKRIHQIYVLPETGQMNVCGINQGNVDNFAWAVFKAVTKKTKERG